MRVTESDGCGWVVVDGKDLPRDVLRLAAQLQYRLQDISFNV
jgi:hypothetical protein